VVTWNGVPVSQASSAERFRIGLAVCEARNPKLRAVLFRHGSLLDQETVAALKDWVAERDFQVFIEQVDCDSEAGAVVIEGGRVRETVERN
jgi:hypothetical protein